ncbi:hypothetical protein [Pseudarthrobacter sp. PS3-L1]|uniref:hypothetical protein n=1 Tax=Pseudarthrobacter sp. PS3-L1 TaxID=3046207 RepID=UPI0024B9B289|nr:hypothetical protein [Pseudarthrobacter sp. PS3-L1]MDJ0321838.1 hypothetical protein [Pseudarthrobacter sp. PS3-L1]
MPTLIREAGTTTRTGPGRILLTLITPGQGSSGAYTAEVLEAAAADVVFPRGTQGHINHDTEFQRMERPEGDLRNLAVVLLEDARVAENGALVAEARVASAWRDFVEEFQEFIGASIAAQAQVKKTADGPVVEKLIPHPFNRVDLVTVAGRGGAITEVLEAAHVIESRSIVKEATANETGELLREALRATYGAQETWVWMRDYDDTKVWFDVEDTDSSATYQQGYTMTDTAVTLAGERVEVRPTTTYLPVEAPNDSAPNPAAVTENQEEATMATIDDKELAALRESASRATTAEAELKKEREDRAIESATARQATAASIVREAFGEDAPAFVTESATRAASAEDFDAEKFTTSVAEAAASFQSLAGAGRPNGNGAQPIKESAEVADSDVLTALKGA